MKMRARCGILSAMAAGTVSAAKLPVPEVVCEKPGGWTFRTEEVSEQAGVAVWKIAASASSASAASADTASAPPAFRVAFRGFPNAGIRHLWHAGSQSVAPMAPTARMTPIWDSPFVSRFGHYQPLYAFIGDGDDNRLTVALAESREEVRFVGGTDNAATVQGEFRLFDGPTRARASYETYLRLDARAVPWHEAVSDAARWMQAAADAKPLNAPVCAYDPVYSTWYAHQERIDAATVEAECAAAAACGMKTVIVDDGWQTAEPCQYANAGDWEVCRAKFPDMKAHVARVHALGLRYIMWYALPYVGKESKAWTQFKDKMLIVAPKFGVVDPRYPEVRACLSGLCAEAMREWDVDGFKLDYLDTFKVYDGKDPGEATGWKGMDTRDVAEATERLVREVRDSLLKIKADALIEFRQHYTGPAIRQYGNLMRVADCPGDTWANRTAIAALRLTCPGTAVHSDMLAWDARHATAEDAALQALNAIFGVVQYSPAFADLPDAHRKMLAHWVKFSLDHREALLFGRFAAHHPEANYTTLAGETGRERVVGVYAAETVVPVPDGGKDVYILNATPAAALVVDVGTACAVEAFDTFGVRQGVRQVPPGLHRLNVPPSGYLRLGRSAAPIRFVSGEATLALSPASGAILSLRTSDGVERAVPADEAFTLQLLDEKGLAIRLRSSDCAFARDGDRLTWTHRSGLRVTLRVTCADGRFSFRPEVTGIPAGRRLEWFDGPQLCISASDTLYWPFYDGCEVTDYALREGIGSWNEYRPLGWTPRRKAWGSLYPGSCQMQFLAAYRDGKGVYFAAEDDRHTPKGVEYERVTDAHIRLSLQTFCGDLAADGAWRPALAYVVRPYDGGWMEACEIYRDWVRRLPGFDQSPPRPKWAYDSPVNLIYPVQGEGIDHGPDPMATNLYYPYTNVMPFVEKYGKAFDAKIMALLMHWEGTAPWCPPYVWPPLGGENALAALRDALHARGDLLGVYCSGTAWTQESAINGYSQKERLEREGLARHMMRGPRGEIEATICNDRHAQRFGYDMCLTEAWTVATLADELRKMASFGLDYCQFFDQNIGGGALLCYARHHAHPSVPGAWQTDAMLALQKRMLDVIDGCGSKMTLGCEGCAATPYVRNLFYNDSREGNDISFGKPVPGVSFVFHEWMCNFSGNQIGHTCDPLYRWTRAFHYGDMLAVVLGPDGQLAHAWGVDWKRGVPEQAPLIGLVRRLNDLRKRHLDFLLEGFMIRPFVRCESAPARLTQGGNAIDTTEVLTSFWQNRKGERIGFASNWTRHPASLTLAWPDGTRETRLLAPLETVTLR